MVIRWTPNSLPRQMAAVHIGMWLLRWKNQRPSMQLGGLISATAGILKALSAMLTRKLLLPHRPLLEEQDVIASG